MPNLQFATLILASALAGFMSASVLLAPLSSAPVSILLTPSQHTLPIDSTFTIDIVVGATTPVNVFKGVMHFDTSRLHIERIDYNTSIADLWAEEPWYSNGDGTLSFIGGTTHPGGFTGTGSLITVTFKTQGVGPAPISLEEVRVLKHDGLGTDVPIPQPIDTLFTVAPEQLEAQSVPTVHNEAPAVTVLPRGKSTDLNGDGKQTIADVSIFMRDLSTQNQRSDFNGDSLVSAKDLSILLQK